MVKFFQLFAQRDIERTGERLGRGAFGVAMIGRYRENDVCIKTVRLDYSSGSGNSAGYTGRSAGYRKGRTGYSGDTGYNSQGLK